MSNRGNTNINSDPIKAVYEVVASASNDKDQKNRKRPNTPKSIVLHSIIGGLSMYMTIIKRFFSVIFNN